MPPACGAAGPSTRWPVLRRELGDEVGAVSIGPAGENLVIQATLLAENEAVGSAGLGAVMGSKNLKAIAVRAVRRRAAVAEPERVKELAAHFRSLGKEPVASAGSLVFRITGPADEEGAVLGLHRHLPPPDLPGRRRAPGQVHVRRRHLLPGLGGDALRARARGPVSRHQALRQLRPGHHGRFHDPGVAAAVPPGRHPDRRNHRHPHLQDGHAWSSSRSCCGRWLSEKASGTSWPRASRGPPGIVGQGSWGLIDSDLSVAGMPNANDPRLYITTALLFAGEPRPPMGVAAGAEPGRPQVGGVYRGAGGRLRRPVMWCDASPNASGAARRRRT